MRLTDDFDDKDSKSGLPVIYMTIGVVTFIALVLCIVISVNQKPAPVQVDVQEQMAEQSPNGEVLRELGIGESNLTSDQLDFWDMYKEDTPVSDNTLAQSEQYEKNLQKLEEEEAKRKQEEDLSEGGTKTMVTRPDGTEQWIMINAYLDKNTYDYVGLVQEESILKYYANGAKASFMGVTIDEDNGTIDFAALKREGVDYVMIKLGYRGYESGTLFIDNNYSQYAQAADAAGLKVGICFESQAISVEEAQEEAQLVISNLAELPVTYPVVFKLGLVANDTSRIENLPKIQLTEITNAFCQMVQDAGYEPMVYGDKYWLLRKIDLTQLGDYDIWLSQEREQPDYPYEFAMWQYKNSGNIEGIGTEVELSISFIDYSQK